MPNNDVNSENIQQNCFIIYFILTKTNRTSKKYILDFHDKYGTLIGHENINQLILSSGI